MAAQRLEREFHSLMIHADPRVTLSRLELLQRTLSSLGREISDASIISRMLEILPKEQYSFLLSAYWTRDNSTPDSLSEFKADLHKWFSLAAKDDTSHRPPTVMSVVYDQHVCKLQPKVRL